MMGVEENEGGIMRRGGANSNFLLCDNVMDYHDAEHNDKLQGDLRKAHLWLCQRAARLSANRGQ